MIGIGVNENVYLEKAELEKENLVLTFQEIALVDKAKMSAFDVLASEEVVDTVNGLSIRVFPPLPPKKDDDRTEEKKIELLTSDINRTKAILHHLAKGYLTADNVKGKMSPFRGLEGQINANNYNQQIQQESILLAIHRNMCTDFINLIRPFLNKPELAFRLLLVRQSKEKNFASLRSKALDESPFWESMEIPKEASKLYTKVGEGFVAKFTRYEVENGLNSSVPVDKKAAGDSKTGGAAGSTAPVSAESIFNKR